MNLCTVDSFVDRDAIHSAESTQQFIYINTDERIFSRYSNIRCHMNGPKFGIIHNTQETRRTSYSRIREALCLNRIDGFCLS